MTKCIFVWIQLLAAIVARGYTAEELEQAKFLANNPQIYLQGKNTYKEYITNKCYFSGITATIIRSGSGPHFASCVKKFAEFYRELAIAEHWKEPRRTVKIPELSRKPSFQDSFDSPIWQEGMSFEGEYELNTVKKREKSARWALGIHQQILYGRAAFFDQTPCIFNGRSQQSAHPIYQGDALEIFFRPDNRQPYYYEILVNPAGETWSLRHAAKTTGSWHILNENFNTAIQAKSRRNTNGYEIFFELPLARLYAQKHSPQPERSDKISSIMLIRTDRTPTSWNRYAITPLLFDGHNIYGFMDMEP